MNTRLDIELTREIPSHRARFFSHIRAGNGAGVQVSAPIFSGAVNSTTFSGSSSGQHETKVILVQAWVEIAPSTELTGLSIVAGKIDPAVFFDHNAVAHDESEQFINNIFVHNPLLDSGGNYGIDENGFSPGAVIQYQTDYKNKPDWAFSLGVFGAGNGENFDQTPGNPSLIVQARRFGEIFSNRTGSSALYYWINPKAINFATEQAERQSGWGFSVDQEVNEDWSVFGRLFYGDKGIRSFDRGFTYGAALKGTHWGRPEDSIALAFGHLQADRKRLAFDPTELFVEKSLEALYRWAMSDNWSISLNYQQIDNPGGNSNNPSVRVVGIRNTVSF